MLPESLKPCIYLFKLFGMYCLDINQPNKSNITGVIWSLIVVVYCVAHSMYGVYERDMNFESLLLTLTDNMQIYMSLINAATCITFLVLMRKKLIFFLEMVNKFDRSFESLINDSSGGKDHKIKMIILTSFLTILICVYVFFDISLYLSEFSFALTGDVMAYCFPFAIAALFVSQFCIMALQLKRRFCWINEKLIQMQRRLNKKPISIIDPLECEKMIKLLENLRHKHDSLCRLSVTLNKVYSLPLLTTILQNFIIIIVTLFMHVEGSQPLRKDYSIIFYNVYDGLVILCNCAETVLMVKACSKTRDESKRTAVILHKFSKTSQELEHFIEFFSMQLMHNNVEFTACDIFVIDESLLFSMVGAISTYLIIVLQLQLDS